MDLLLENDKVGGNCKLLLKIKRIASFKNHKLRFKPESYLISGKNLYS